MNRPRAIVSNYYRLRIIMRKIHRLVEDKKAVISNPHLIMFLPYDGIPYRTVSFVSSAEVNFTVYVKNTTDDAVFADLNRIAELYHRAHISIDKARPSNA